MTQNRYLLFEAYYSAAGETLSYLRNLVEHANRESWQPTLVCPGDGVLPATILEAGGDVTIVPQSARLDRYDGPALSSGLIGRVAVMAALILYNIRLIPTLRQLQPRIIQCHNVRSLLMIGLAARLLNIPTILNLRSEPGRRFLDRLAHRLAHRILVPSPSLIPAKRRTKCTALTPGANFDDVDRVLAARPAGVDPEDNKEHLTFAFAGALLPVNGAHVLIDAFERTTHHISDIRLVLIGDSDDESYKQELRNVVDWQRLDQRVSFHANTSEIAELLEDADVFVEPALAGGVTTAFLKAMALGKPVISTTAGGAADILDDGTLGVLVAIDDSAALAEAMFQIGADRELRKTYASAASATARTHYDLNTHMTALEAVFSEVTAGRSRKHVSETTRAAA